MKLPSEWQGRCVFCDSPDEPTDEHIIAKTVRKQLPAITSIRQLFRGHVGRERSVIHMVLDKAVCHTCNDGWMGDSDEDLVRLLGPQIRNEGTARLDPVAQERVATWAVKTGLGLLLWFTAQGTDRLYVSNECLKWLPVHVSPPPGSRVWLGRVNPKTMASWGRAGSFFSEFPAIAPIGYQVLWSIGALVVLVVGQHDLIPSRPGSTSALLSSLQPPQDTLVEIWPGTGDDASWPPLRILEANDLPAFSEWPRRFLASPPHLPPKPSGPYSSS